MSPSADVSLPNESGIRPGAELARLTPWRPILAGVCNWFWIIAAMAVGQQIGWNVVTVPLAMIVTGIHLHRNAVLGHEGAHYLISKNRLANDLFVNILFFWPAFATVSGYRAWHLQHHRWLGTDKDPEYEVKSGARYRLPKSRWGLIGECVLDLFGYGANEVLQLLWVIRPKRTIEVAGPILWWAVVGGLLLLTGNGVVVLIIVASLLTTFWSVFRLRAWFEHMGIKGTHRFSVNPVVAYIWFPHNTWCHYEHHRWPYVPYYSLPATRGKDVALSVNTVTGILTLFEETNLRESTKEKNAEQHR